MRPNLLPQHQQDFDLVEKILNGCDQAASALRARYESAITGTLCARGASKTEAEDLLADLWSDCFGGGGASRSILSRYGGRCPLGSWLITIATHRLVDLKRRQGFRVELSRDSQSEGNPFDRLPGPAHEMLEPTLCALMLRALQRAFMSCDADTMLMLKLVHLHKITQRELGRMWNWHESKVSRTLDAARNQIRKVALDEVKRFDPWLELTWSDFSELCRCSPDLLGAAENDDSSQRSVLRQSNR